MKLPLEAVSQEIFTSLLSDERRGAERSIQGQPKNRVPEQFHLLEHNSSIGLL
jgi:hypothetical protein